jgi:hypothetical protein
LYVGAPDIERKIRKVQERSGDDQHSFTYISSGVGVEGRVMDEEEEEEEK